MYACSDPPPEGLEPSTMPTKPQGDVEPTHCKPQDNDTIYQVG